MIIESVCDAERQLETLWEWYDIGTCYRVHLCCIHNVKALGIPVPRFALERKPCLDLTVNSFTRLEQVVKGSLPHCDAIVVVERRL